MNKKNRKSIFSLNFKIYNNIGIFFFSIFLIVFLLGALSLKYTEGLDKLYGIISMLLAVVCNEIYPYKYRDDNE